MGVPELRGVQQAGHHGVRPAQNPRGLPEYQKVPEPHSDDSPRPVHRSLEAVLFDAGNTLVFVDPDRVLAIFAEMGVPTTPESFREAEFAARGHLERVVEEGAAGTEEHVWREYFVTLFRECGVPDGVVEEIGERIRAAHRDEHLWSHVAEDTGPALERLRREGYRLGVVSNADGRVEALLTQTGLHEHFEFVLDSHVVGVEKPDPRIFRAATDRLGVEPGRCLYVGDLYQVDVVGARAAGLRPLLLDPWERLEVDVETIPSVAHLPDYLEGPA